MDIHLSGEPLGRLDVVFDRPRSSRIGVKGRGNVALFVGPDMFECFDCRLGLRIEVGGCFVGCHRVIAGDDRELASGTSVSRREDFTKAVVICPRWEMSASERDTVSATASALQIARP
jgi:hypothetical protein